MRVMYPGSFDPITLGHIDLIERCSRMFEEVVVAIMGNDSKQGTFSMAERLELAQESVKHLPNVEVKIGDGLTVDYAVKENCTLLIRGIRAVMDYEYELQHAATNRVLNPKIETLFLVADPHYSYISSSVAREIARFGGDLKSLVPCNVADRLIERYAQEK
ncbi:pantetheine-phosphate adenylyltransferase [Erysipelothrix sp. HDW6B]|uniref:pantetheine-phosphate adenylyltransferase n=1 Tax=Erysipelothrix TaxID=1647 RepID=UPI00135956F3|nr:MULTISPECIES: pantetheine-phosphate adenylyltransferase [Erysipelothrix]QIK85810.1 pantetheine-phosphate adenylyltransferase [Erysipelothrix sp. HDW6B]